MAPRRHRRALPEAQTLDPGKDPVRQSALTPKVPDHAARIAKIRRAAAKLREPYRRDAPHPTPAPQPATSYPVVTIPDIPAEPTIDQVYQELETVLEQLDGPAPIRPRTPRVDSAEEDAPVGVPVSAPLSLHEVLAANPDHANWSPELREVALALRPPGVKRYRMLVTGRDGRVVRVTIPRPGH